MTCLKFPVQEEDNTFQNQEFLEMILDNLNEGFVVQDKNSKILFFNESACSILQMSKEQLLGKTSLDPKWKTIREDGTDFPGTEHPTFVALKTGKPCKNVIAGIQYGEAQPRWIFINAYPMKTRFRGEDAEVLVTFADVTEKINTEKFLSGLIHNSPGMIYQFKLDTNGNVSFPFVSSGAFDIFEITKADLEKDQDYFLNAIHPEDRLIQIEETQKSALHLTDFEWVGRIYTKSKKMKWIRVKSTPRKERDGAVIWEGIVLDITNEKIWQKHLKTSEQRPSIPLNLPLLVKFRQGSLTKSTIL